MVLTVRFWVQQFCRTELLVQFSVLVEDPLNRTEPDHDSTNHVSMAYTSDSLIGHLSVFVAVYRMPIAPYLYCAHMFVISYRLLP